MSLTGHISGESTRVVQPTSLPHLLLDPRRAAALPGSVPRAQRSPALPNKRRDKLSYLPPAAKSARRALCLRVAVLPGAHCAAVPGACRVATSPVSAGGTKQEHRLDCSSQPPPATWGSSVCPQGQGLSWLFRRASAAQSSPGRSEARLGSHSDLEDALVSRAPV